MRYASLTANSRVSPPCCNFKSLILEIILPPGKAVAFVIRLWVFLAVFQDSFVAVRRPHHHRQDADGAVVLCALGDFLHHGGHVIISQSCGSATQPAVFPTSLNTPPVFP